MKITAEVRGLPELLQNIRSLGQAFSNEVEEKALKEAAKPFAEDVRVRIEADHRDTGLTGKDITVAASREARSEGSAAVLVGASEDRAFILSWLEFGTFRTPGYHIVAGSFRQNVGGYMSALQKHMATAFERGVRKHLRRSAA